MHKFFTRKFEFILPVVLCGNLLFGAQALKDINLTANISFESNKPSTESTGNLFKISTSRKSIKLKKDKIVKDIKIGEKVVYATVGVSSVICALMAYKFAKYIFDNDVKIKKTGALSNLELTEKILKLEKGLEMVGDPKFLSQKWFKNFAENAVFNFFTSSLVGTCVGIFGDFYRRHSGFYNLNEFVGTKTSNLMRFDAFLNDAKILSKLKLDESQDNILYCNELRFRLISRLRNIVSDLEGVIAFMEYKIDSIDNIILKKEDILIPDYLFNCLNNYCNSLQGLSKDQVDQDLYDLSLDFSNNFMSIINTFEGFEARVAWINSVA